MHKFLDGPAKGVVLSCSRAPIFLRVTENSSQGKDGFDALDILEDQPEPGEKLHAYIRQGEVGTVHYDGRDRNGKRFGRWEQIADYRLFDPQPDDATMRSREKWEAWCYATWTKMQAEKK